MRKSYTRTDDTERRLVVNMRQAGLKWKTIQDITSRASPTLKYFCLTKKYQLSQVNVTERRLVVNMRRAGLTWKTIQDITSRSPSTLSRILSPPAKKKLKSNPKGAPKKLPTKIRSTRKVSARPTPPAKKNPKSKPKDAPK